LTFVFIGEKNRCAPLAVAKDKALGIQLLLQRYKMFQKGETKGQNLLRVVGWKCCCFEVMGIADARYL
jgi:hypothetical protein